MLTQLLINVVFFERTCQDGMTQTQDMLLLGALCAALICFWLTCSIFGALLTSFATYIIPSAVYIIAFRKVETRKAATMQPPAFLGRSWNVAFAINIFIIFTIAIVGTGFGGWASIAAFIAASNQYKVFGACYQCTAATPVPSAPRSG